MKWHGEKFVEKCFRENQRRAGDTTFACLSRKINGSLGWIIGIDCVRSQSSELLYCNNDTIFIGRKAQRATSHAQDIVKHGAGRSKSLGFGTGQRSKAGSSHPLVDTNYSQESRQIILQMKSIGLDLSTSRISYCLD
ncbi:hypothetical protein RRG08_029008 [Elysia crispata]|uniref:Uncharacterized protein n=1 Tax=Elysia crispata TaxID=231223 RepID=A0AAE1BA66_9GAST|nr:hypothetical protein RRG08_029008 [Elysia crispata]